MNIFNSTSSGPILRSVLFNLLLFLIFLELVPGCATRLVAGKVKKGPLKGDLLLKIEYVDQERKTVPFIESEKGVMLVFKAIPGEIFGAPSPKQEIRRLATSEGYFIIDLDLMEKMLRGNSQVLRNSIYTTGLSIFPKQTRLARLGTWAVDSLTYKKAGASGFLDKPERDGLILVYVDRPCSIYGTVESFGKSVDHDVRLDRPGLHWLRFRELDVDRISITEYHPTDVVFSISKVDKLEGIPVDPGES